MKNFNKFMCYPSYTYKVYSFTHVKEISKDYFAIPYIEYREDGKVVMTGEEDFSKERMSTIKMYSIFVHDGIYGHGLKKWKEVGLVKVMRRKDALLYGKKMFPDQEVQVRKLY